MALALTADTTARYLSFLETGRAQPTADMVVRLCRALKVPESERNALLTSAGYAPRYRETGLDSPEMQRLRALLQDFLDHQEPYPAVVTDRYLNLLMTNRACERIHSQFFDSAKLWPDGRRNTLDTWLSPLGYRPWLENWEEIARWILTLAHQRFHAAPADPVGERYFERWLAHPGVRELWRSPEPGAAVAQHAGAPRLRRGGLLLEWQLLLFTVGNPQSALHKELRITLVRPANVTMKRYCAWLSETRGEHPFAAFERIVRRRV